MTVTISAIPYSMLDDLWPVAEHWMEKAARVTKGLFRGEDIKESLDNRVTALWLVFEDDVPIAAYTTRIEQYPNGRGLIVDWVGGRKLSDWVEKVEEMLTVYAKDNGCIFIEGRGRKGWVRELSKMGWESVPTIRKEVVDERRT